MLPDTPRARHRAIATGFGRVAGQVTDWEAPSPVADWRARDVVGHLIDWSRGFLSGGAGITLPPNDASDPAAAWAAHAAAIQALLDDPAAQDKVLHNPHLGEVPLAQAIDRFYTGDVFMHTWDLAQSADVDDELDPDFAGEMLTGMTAMEQALRDSGQFGPAVAAPADASVVTRLMAFVGRDPGWRAR